MKKKFAILATLLIVSWWVFQLIFNQRIGNESNDMHSIKSPPLLDKVSSVPEPKKVDEMTEIEINKMWSTEIVFFGKVIDQSGIPVPGAEVIYSRPAKPGEIDPMVGFSTIKSDESGCFKISEFKAPWLKVGVQKDGYGPTERSEQVFYYASPPSRILSQFEGSGVDRHVPNIDEPVEFVISKFEAADPIFRIDTVFKIGTGREYSISLDQAPSINMMNGKESNPGDHSIEVALWANKGNIVDSRNGKLEPFNWSMTMSSKSGGFSKFEIEPKAGSAILAPEGGYSDVIRFSQNKESNQNDWRPSIENSYFVKFLDGTFARFSIKAVMDPAVPYVRITSFYNPSGGRNTLFDPSKIANSRR